MQKVLQVAELLFRWVSKLPVVLAIWIPLPASAAYFTDVASHVSWGLQECLKIRSLAKSCSSDVFLFNLAKRGDSLKI